MPSFLPTEDPLGFPMPDRQARQLDTLLKSLPKTKEHAYRKAVTAKTPTELNPGKRYPHIFRAFRPIAPVIRRWPGPSDRR